MGQYWMPVNITKKEYLDPHKIGVGDGFCGLKLWEQLNNQGVGEGLIILLADMPEKRGGGDLNPDPIIGSWKGDAVVIAGDYAEEGELGFGHYFKCSDDPDYKDVTADVMRVLKVECCDYREKEATNNE